MKNYIVYDVNGAIIRTGVCEDSMLALEAKEGETVIEGIASDVKHLIVNGQVQDKPINLVEVKAEVQEQLRRIRNIKLINTDWTQLKDIPLTTAMELSWASYRQDLRDLPALFADITSIDEVVWPVPPA